MYRAHDDASAAEPCVSSSQTSNCAPSRACRVRIPPAGHHGPRASASAPGVPPTGSWGPCPPGYAARPARGVSGQPRSKAVERGGDMTTPDAERREQSIAEHVRGLSEESAALVREQAQLIREDLIGELKRLGIGGGMLAGAGLLGLGAFGTLTAGVGGALGGGARGAPGRASPSGGGAGGGATRGAARR